MSHHSSAASTRATGPAKTPDQGRAAPRPSSRSPSISSLVSTRTDTPTPPQLLTPMPAITTAAPPVYWPTPSMSMVATRWVEPRLGRAGVLDAVVFIVSGSSFGGDLSHGGSGCGLVDYCFGGEIGRADV